MLLAAGRLLVEEWRREEQLESVSREVELLVIADQLLVRDVLGFPFIKSF